MVRDGSQWRDGTGRKEDKESQTGTPQREESNILGAQEDVEKCPMHPRDSRSKLRKGTEIEAE